jgi:hypothetical protein
MEAIATATAADPNVYLDTPRIRVSWDPHLRCIRLEYREWHTTQELDIGMEAFLRALEEHAATRCLSDSRFRRVIQPDAQRVLTERWIPQAAAQGLRRLAIVLPQSQLTRTTLEPVVTVYRAYVEVATFGSVETAEAWLAAG